MWFIENIGTIIVGVALVALVAFVIVNAIKNKKKGKSGCGCGCSNCSISGMCHKTEESDK